SGECAGGKFSRTARDLGCDHAARGRQAAESESVWRRRVAGDERRGLPYQYEPRVCGGPRGPSAAFEEREAIRCGHRRVPAGTRERGRVSKPAAGISERESDSARGRKHGRGAAEYWTVCLREDDRLLPERQFADEREPATVSS